MADALDQYSSRELQKLRQHQSNTRMDTQKFVVNSCTNRPICAMALSQLRPLVNAQDGLLLIDEFENGMHHTVQLDVWRAVLEAARKLDIQVFATSHRWDSVEAFQKAAAETPEDGVLVRLSRKGEDIIPTLSARTSWRSQPVIESRCADMADRKILLVEGPDDEHVLKHICGNRGIARLDEVKPHGGVEQLLESIPVQVKAGEDGDIVGVVIDADTDVKARWQSVRDRLINLGYQDVPGRPHAGRQVLDPPHTYCGHEWVFGSCRTIGATESWKTSPLPRSAQHTLQPRQVQCRGDSAGRSAFQSPCRAQGYYSHVARVAGGPAGLLARQLPPGFFIRTLFRSMCWSPG